MQKLVILSIGLFLVLSFTGLSCFTKNNTGSVKVTTSPSGTTGTNTNIKDNQGNEVNVNTSGDNVNVKDNQGNNVNVQTSNDDSVKVDANGQSVKVDY
ncbi:hypothetical protein A3F08_01810 [Candidatus Berkelbacteria bacterium RIFCSPHIGHO2_12_FULL_36_9]|uniref:Uncharacterized protein n=1 Tax=Candidatus Berkelbacteria bacterium RIFCSPHIGHO2_12_FULL_36_9 TaxID=1797469 RepID=A0A1F5EEE2_9BACT|nr:MAG: hypothetical protein A3F08_01810 [Candidatus Berkelbacteria bacterium RIFCSPHIGHO2_12_FULL_36_9]